MSNTAAVKVSAQHEVCLARQPIIDENCNVVAYELLFRQLGESTANVFDNTMATYSVINNAFTNMGITSVLGNKRAFINFDAKTLKSDITDLLPCNNIVIEILEDVEPDDELIEQIKRLRQQNCQFALDDFVYRQSLEQFLPLVDIIKIDITQLDQAALRQHVEFGKEHNKVLLAEKVENHNQFDLCKSLGFTMFQGYFLAKPRVLVQSDLPASKLRIIAVMNQIMGEADNAIIVRDLSHDLSLCYKLLKFINSVGRSCGKQLNHISEAVAILGRNALYRWLSLLLFTSSDENDTQSNALFNLSFYRGRLMELFGEASGHKSANELFILGTFSYLEALLNRRLSLILKDLVIPPLIKQALVEQDGPYWPFLRLVQAIERGDTTEIVNVSASLGLTMDNINEMQLSATIYCESLCDS